MSGYSEASRQAFRRVNVTAGQEKILAFLRARPSLKPTRGEISMLTGIPINVVTARINELLYDFERPKVRELPVRDGAHPLELIENAPRSTHCDGNLAVLPTQEIASHAARPINAAGQIRGDLTPVGATNPENKSAPAASRYVHPHLPHRMSMTLAEAQRSTGLEAELVRKLKRSFRVWGENIQFCADVDALIHAPDRVAA